MQSKTTGHIIANMVNPSRREDTHLKLLEAGLALFSEQGFHGTGIKEIVEAVGVPKGSFYNYFHSKEDFGAEIIRHYSENFGDKWAQYLAQGAQDDPLQTLRQSYGLIIQHHERCATKTGCLVGNLAAEIAESSELCRRALATAMHAWRERFADYLRRAQAAGTVRQDLSAETLTDFFWNAWEGALLRMKIENSTQPVRQCVDMMFDHFFKP